MFLIAELMQSKSFINVRHVIPRVEEQSHKSCIVTAFSFDSGHVPSTFTTVMNNSPSTPFPAPSFQNADSDASPKQFLDFLRNLIAENFQDDDPTVTKPASERDNWVTIVNGLSEYFLASFPFSNGVPWNSMQEKLELIDYTLEIIIRVTSRVETAYAGPGDAAKTLFTHLITLSSALDWWLDVEVTNKPGVPTPLHLRDKTIKATVGLLRHLGSCMPSGAGSDPPAWKKLREIMIECLDLIHGMWSGS